MTVTQITDITNKRCRVFVDEEFAFVLYKGELRRYHLREQEEIEQEIYDEIMTQVLPKRAKLRAMNLLKSREYTCRQLQDKLRDGGYPPPVIEEAVEYMKSYHYIDDERYARTYIEYSMEKKSRQKMIMDLQQRGIPRETVISILSELEEQGIESDEIQMMHRLLEKKKYDAKKADNAEKQRVFAYLYRRGFRTDNIRKVMDFSPFT